MDHADAEQRIAEVLAGFAGRRLRAAPDLLTQLAAVSGQQHGPAASAPVARLVAGSIDARQADLDATVAAVAEVLAESGAPPQDGRDTAFSLVRELEALARAGFDDEDLGRAAQLLAGLAVGRDASDDVRAAQIAWTQLDTARRATLPASEGEMRRLLAAGPEALERHRADRGRELGVDGLHEEFSAAWRRCLSG